MSNITIGSVLSTVNGKQMKVVAIDDSLKYPVTCRAVVGNLAFSYTLEGSFNKGKTNEMDLVLELTLEVGKKFIARDGSVWTIIATRDSTKYPFIGAREGRGNPPTGTFSAKGEFQVGEENDSDLVSVA